MSRISQNLSAFISGELSPLLNGRTDLQRYHSACEDITNMVVMPQGGLMKRPGIIKADSSYIDEKVRLIPFVYNQDTSYVLEFGTNYVRVLKNGAVVTILGTTTNTITSIYSLADVWELQFKQQGDVLFIVHHDYPPMQLVRFSENNWGFIKLHFQDGPYLDQNITDTEISQEVAETGKTFDINGIACDGSSIDVTGGRKGLINSCDTDDQVWTDRSLSGTKTINKIHYINGYFVAVGNKSLFANSPDGQSWTSRSGPVSGNPHLYDVLIAGSAYLFVGQDGLIRRGTGVTPSSMAGTWTTITTGLTDIIADKICLRGIAYSQSMTRVIVVGDSGTILYSYSGTSWQTMTSGITTDLHAVAYLDGVGFVAVGKGGVILSSANGVIWTLQQSYVSVNFNDVFVVGSKFYVVGNQGYVLTSTDMVNWVISNLGRNYDWTCGCASVKSSNRTIIIGGKEGIVARSTDNAGTDWDIQAMVTVQFVSTDSLFTQDDVGRKFRWQKMGTSKDWGWGNIIKVISPIDILVDVRSTFDATANSTTWRLGTFYNGNYPSCVDFYEQRLILANVPDDPAGMWGSVSGDYINFRPSDLGGTVSDSDAISYFPTVTDEVKWLESVSVLLVGYGSGIGRISGSALDDALTPTNVIFRIQCSDGTANIKPILVGSSIIYVHSSRRKVRKLDYNDTLNVWESSDLIIMSDHLGEKMIAGMAFQKIPFGILWCWCDDGTIIAATYEKDHEVIAWHKHTITGGLVESISVIPTSGGEDEVWISFDLGSSRSIGYLSHFENAYTTPFCFVDNSVLSSGAYTGIAFTGKARTVDLELALSSGTVQGKLRRIASVMARLYQTGQIKLGYSSSKCDTVYNSSTLFTGDKQLNFPSGYERDCHVYFESSENVPCTVLSIVPDEELPK